MLANERQRKIKELIMRKHTLRISELSEQLDVSEMTIHRDIKPLVAEGLIEKTYGGISLIHHDLKQPNNNECVVCYRTIDHRLSCKLILTNNRVESTCCAHCGLIRYKMIQDEVMEILCCDFFTNTTINAANAWFVMDTSINLGCCQPQIITFRQREHADGFIKGFGGVVVNFTKAIERQRNQKGCCHG